MCLAVSGFSCGTEGLWSSLWHAGSLVAACGLLVGVCETSSLTRDRTKAPCIGSVKSATELPEESPSVDTLAYIILVVGLTVPCWVWSSIPTLLPTSQYSSACMLSCFSHVRFFVTLWTVACQAPLSWNSPGKNTGVGCHALFQGVFLTQGSNQCLLHYRLILYSWATGEA